MRKKEVKYFVANRVVDFLSNRFFGFLTGLPAVTERREKSHVS